MSRLDYLTIGIVALCIAALIYLVYRYVNLPHSAENVQPTTAVIEKDTARVAPTDLNGFPAEDTSENIKPGPSTVVQPETKPENTTTKPEIKKPDPAPVVESIETNSSNESASASAGRYMVIAGSFKEMSRAKEQLRRVQKLGYNTARIEKFNRGTYASVLVDRFDQDSQAKALMNTLKSKGLDAMVLAKK